MYSENDMCHGHGLIGKLLMSSKAAPLYLRQVLIVRMSIIQI